LLFTIHKKAPVAHGGIATVEKKQGLGSKGVISPLKINGNVYQLKRPVLPMHDFMDKKFHGKLN